MQSRYPIRAVARMTGLSLDTLRAWERRYQAVVPERSERGRQYGPAEIERLLRLGSLVRKGYAIGQIAALSNPELEQLLSQPHGPSGVVTPQPRKTDFLGPILSAIESFDAATAADELSRLAAILAPRDLVYDVALPLMREIGTRWHEGTLRVAQEHMFSHLLRNLLGSMLRIVRPLHPGVRMLFATPTGEPHEFGILAAAMLGSMAGLEPVYLGASLPALEIAEAARRTSSRVVMLGITTPTPNTLAEVSALTRALPEQTRLWLGGEGSASLGLPLAEVTAIVIPDLPTFETECRRLTA